MRTAVNALSAHAAAIMVAVAAAWLLAAPAQAGGPTSVLLVVPGGGGTTALYYDDPEYTELAGLVGADYGAAPVRDNTGAGHGTESAVTVTWLVHDVQVWRVDRIYLGGTGGPWLASQVGYGGDLGELPISWHRPTQPKALLALLDRLGLDLTGGDGDSPLTDAEPAPEPTQVERGAAPARPAAEQDAPAPDHGTPWLLLAVAGLTGALVTAVATLPQARRARLHRAAVVAAKVQDEPVTVAETAEADIHGADSEARWSTAEELVTRH